ncbi:hypothetical protein PAPYR_2401 [Paratrimastix pyriformis]|uniref:Uncharacterized protein n=1 Tax=Paratrimastix pyriformis TaxID=342808 RepID=A0ABQ8UR80_9EUKA|nr:hypothetical protein PAPYR_2401 [Paratrimastix pyriformis]
MIMIPPRPPPATLTGGLAASGGLAGSKEATPRPVRTGSGSGSGLSGSAASDGSAGLPAPPPAGAALVALPPWAPSPLALRRIALFALGNMAAHEPCRRALMQLGLEQVMGALEQEGDSFIRKYLQRLRQKLDAPATGTPGAPGPGSLSGAPTRSHLAASPAASSSTLLYHTPHGTPAPAGALGSRGGLGMGMGTPGGAQGPPPMWITPVVGGPYRPGSAARGLSPSPQPSPPASAVGRPVFAGGPRVMSAAGGDRGHLLMPASAGGHPAPTHLGGLPSHGPSPRALASAHRR